MIMQALEKDKINNDSTGKKANKMKGFGGVGTLTALALIMVETKIFKNYSLNVIDDNHDIDDEYETEIDSTETSEGRVVTVAGSGFALKGTHDTTIPNNYKVSVTYTSASGKTKTETDIRISLDHGKVYYFNFRLRGIYTVTVHDAAKTLTSLIAMSI